MRENEGYSQLMSQGARALHAGSQQGTVLVWELPSRHRAVKQCALESPEHEVLGRLRVQSSRETYRFGAMRGYE